MPLDLVGTFPIAIANPGLAYVPAVQALRIADVGQQIAALGGAITKRASYKLAGPSLGDLATETQLLNQFLAGLPTSLTPTSWSTSAASFKVDILGLLAGLAPQIALTKTINGICQAGLLAPSIAAWTYYGSAEQFALRERNWGTVLANDAISATVLTSENPADWAVFGQSFFTGDPTRKGATFLGELSGGALNTGVLAFQKPLLDFQKRLEGQSGGLELQLKVAGGLNFPPLSGLLDAAKNVDLSALLKNSATVSVDFGAQISGLNASLRLLEGELGKVNFSLGTTGPTVWKYTGPADGLGSSIQSKFKGGVPGGLAGPGGRISAMVLATSSASFGAIFKLG